MCATVYVNWYKWKSNFVSKYFFWKNLLIFSTSYKLYKNIQFVYDTNEEDCVTAANIIDLLYMHDHCSMSELNRMNNLW